jgi:Type III flagellar switch regulator (C-ring) FliN C-term
MATQSPPQPVPPPASAIPSQTAPQQRPVPGQVGALDGGATSLIPSGNARANEAADGEVKADIDSEFLRLPAPVERLPVGLLVSVPVRDFRVRNLLAMAPDELIETQWGHGEDLPLSSGDVQLAWSEFEVVDTRLAVRVTRLA